MAANVMIENQGCLYTPTPYYTLYHNYYTMRTGFCSSVGAEQTGDVLL